MFPGGLALVFNEKWSCWFQRKVFGDFADLAWISSAIWKKKIGKLPKCRTKRHPCFIPRSLVLGCPPPLWTPKTHSQFSAVGCFTSWQKIECAHEISDLLSESGTAPESTQPSIIFWAARFCDKNMILPILILQYASNPIKISTLTFPPSGMEIHSASSPSWTRRWSGIFVER